MKLMCYLSCYHLKVENDLKIDQSWSHSEREKEKKSMQILSSLIKKPRKKKRNKKKGKREEKRKLNLEPKNLRVSPKVV